MLSNESNLHFSNNKRFPNKDAALDLVIEAHVLAALSHLNILCIRGMGEFSSKQWQYFWILDQLKETLKQRIVRWDR